LYNIAYYKLITQLLLFIFVIAIYQICFVGACNWWPLNYFNQTICHARLGGPWSLRNLQVLDLYTTHWFNFISG